MITRVYQSTTEELFNGCKMSICGLPYMSNVHPMPSGIGWDGHNIRQTTCTHVKTISPNIILLMSISAISISCYENAAHHWIICNHILSALLVVYGHLKIPFPFKI